jgi:hypothetical protein
MHNYTIEKAKEIDPVLTVGFSAVFPRENGHIEDGFAAHEVQTMRPDVAQSLRFIPSGHCITL